MAVREFYQKENKKNVRIRTWPSWGPQMESPTGVGVTEEARIGHN